MTHHTHPERFANRIWTPAAHRETELARRQGTIVQVYETWINGAGSFLDINALGLPSDGPDDIPVGDLGLDENCYLHFGSEQAAWLSNSKEVFVDGLYLNRQEFKGRSGYFLTLVTDRVVPTGDASVEDACIACGWIDAELPIDDAMTLLGLWGDSSIVDSARRFEIEFLVGKVISTVGEALDAAPKSVAPGFH